MKKSYDDIRDVKYPVPTTRPRMSMHDRAAQFSPFAALTGYEEVIEETVRTSESRCEAAQSLQNEDSPYEA